MILVTGSNERYAPRMNPYLASLQEYATFPVYQVGVGFMPAKVYSKVAPVCLTHEQNAGSPPETECIQHGSFLSVIPDKGTTDTIMYTDGDFTMQRALTEDDWQYLRLEHGQVSIGYNGGSDETLLTEYHRLGPKVSGLQMETLWGGDWHTLPIYNVGCIAATRGTWEYIHRTYMKSWHIAGDCFQHQARQQWLISWIVSGLDVKILPWSFHAHGHFGMKPGMTRQGEQIYHDGKLALFRHYF